MYQKNLSDIQIKLLKEKIKYNKKFTISGLKLIIKNLDSYEEYVNVYPIVQMVTRTNIYHSKEYIENMLTNPLYYPFIILLDSTENGVGLTEDRVGSSDDRVGSGENRVDSTDNGVDLTEDGLSSKETGVNLKENRLGSSESGLSSKEAGFYSNSVNSSDLTENRLNSTTYSLNSKENSLNSTENSLDSRESGLSSKETGFDSTSDNSLDSTSNSLDSTTNSLDLKETGLNSTDKELTLGTGFMTVGYFEIYLMPHLGRLFDSRLERVIVHPEYRKKGIFTYMLTFVIDFCKSTLMCNRIDLTSNNPIAERGYKTFQFEHINTNLYRKYL
uniref:Acetyltransferase (GNAT) family, putative n=1 Tax=Theileria annulata TaxID=5874 RepID=A0A3B0MK70_THEAN